MTKRWKLKTNSTNILLVLITLILVKAEWATAKNDQDEDWNNSVEEDPKPQLQMYVGHDEIAQYYFGQSTTNSSLILEGVNRCLDSFQLITCVKMLLLDKLNDAAALLEDPRIAGRDLHFLRGAIVFRVKNETNASEASEKIAGWNLDEEITAKLLGLFRKRSLVVNLLPKIQMEVEPVKMDDGGEFVCFSYRIQKEKEEEEAEGRKRKGGMSMMMIPPMIMLGLMPFTLASIKAMVMNAVMINMMALNGAIFMTIRNLVFGPRKGDNVKYVNYGYSKDRQTQSKRPVLIIHSPAAFVKQPKVHKKPVPGHRIKPHVVDTYLPVGYTSGHSGGHEEEYYIIQEDEGHNIHHQEIQRRQDVVSPKLNPYQRVKYHLGNQKTSSNYIQRAPRPGPGHFERSQIKGTPPRTGSNTLENSSERRKPPFKPSPQWDPIPLDNS